MSSTVQISRRSALAGAAAAIALTTFRRSLRAQQPGMHAQNPSMDQSRSANQMLTSLHQVVELSAPPERIFHILLDSKEFAAFTGMAATIDPAPGGAFNMFSGMIEGRNIEIISNRRIVQAWRPTSWDSGVYSVVHFELKASGAPGASSIGTTLVLDHTGFPQGDFDHLDPGWHMRYWDPLKKYLAANL